MSDSWAALYIAYSIVWLGFFSYLVYVFLKLKSVERDIRNLSEVLKKHDR
jgi:CcmD family protein